MSTHKKTYNELGERWCGKGKHYMHIKYFTKNRESADGIEWRCVYCKSKKSVAEVDRQLAEKWKREFIKAHTPDQPAPGQKRVVMYLTKSAPVQSPTWEYLLKTKLISKPCYL